MSAGIFQFIITVLQHSDVAAALLHQSKKQDPLVTVEPLQIAHLEEVKRWKGQRRKFPVAWAAALAMVSEIKPAEE
jgi:hypothetical protein